MNSLLLLSIRENPTFDFNYFSGGLPIKLGFSLIQILYLQGIKKKILRGDI